MSESEAGGLLQLQGVTKKFGEVTAVDDLSLALKEGEFVTLLGPSGCGKTTALRLIAGFESPGEGRIVFDGGDVTRWTPQRRGFGMVFQNYALFPHLNVFENVAFGLRARKTGEDQVKAKVGEALRIVDLAGYGERAVQALSGGQQQRVALARALAIEPPLLLLDEPLSNLDQALRVRTRTELRELVKELGITALFVTHDQEEAFDLSDRIAVMRAGRLRQFGSPRELYDEPSDRFVAGFVGRANTLPVRIEDGAVQLGSGMTWRLEQAPGWRTSPGMGLNGEGRGSGRGTGRDALMLLRPEELEFVDERGGEAAGWNSIPGVVREARFRGAVTYYEVELGVSGAGGGGGGGGRGGSSNPAKVLFEVAGPPGGPGPGSRIGLRPARGVRPHLFPGEDG
jgi:ABC-type Fe3+/spermidine/putrescine transport system ATPase subunit